MRINEGVKLIGNFNRVRELQEGGVGINCCAGAFLDCKMDLTAQDVETMIKLDKILTKKILPRKYVVKIIAANKKFKESLAMENIDDAN